MSKMKPKTVPVERYIVCDGCHRTLNGIIGPCPWCQLAAVTAERDALAAEATKLRESIHTIASMQVLPSENIWVVRKIKLIANNASEKAKQ